MFSNEVSRDKAFLVVMELADSPGGQAVIDEVGVHFTVSVHGRDRSVVSSEGRVTLLEKEADIGILETATGGAIDFDIIG